MSVPCEPWLALAFSAGCQLGRAPIAINAETSEGLLMPLSAWGGCCLLIPTDFTLGELRCSHTVLLPEEQGRVSMTSCGSHIWPDPLSHTSGRDCVRWDESPLEMLGLLTVTTGEMKCVYKSFQNHSLCWWIQFCFSWKKYDELDYMQKKLCKPEVNSPDPSTAFRARFA